ncbi:hypothetical protein Tco_0496112 [Tanacetum coccineum]
MATIRNFNPPAATGKGPAMSIPHLWNGHGEVMGVSSCCGWRGIGLCTWQSLHFLIMNVAQAVSRCMVGWGAGHNTQTVRSILSHWLKERTSIEDTISKFESLRRAAYSPGILLFMRERALAYEFNDRGHPRRILLFYHL